MTYGICNCVRPPSHGMCNACGMNFGPTPGTSRAPVSSPSEIHHHAAGPSADEIRQIVREEIARALRESANG